MEIASVSKNIYVVSKYIQIIFMVSGSTDIHFILPNNTLYYKGEQGTIKIEHRIEQILTRY